RREAQSDLERVAAGPLPWPPSGSFSGVEAFRDLEVRLRRPLFVHLQLEDANDEEDPLRLAHVAVADEPPGPAAKCEAVRVDVTLGDRAEFVVPQVDAFASRDRVRKRSEPRW